MAGTVGQRAMAVCLLLLCSGSFVVSFNSGVLAPGSVTVRGRFGVCPSLRATRAGAADVTMGMRDKFKATLAALGAAFSITTAPHSASAAPSRVAEAPAQEDVQQPMSLQPMMLPSQASHYKQMARGGDHIVVATAKQLALDRRVHFVVGAGVAGGAGYVILSNSNKKKNDDVGPSLSHDLHSRAYSSVKSFSRGTGSRQICLCS